MEGNVAKEDATINRELIIGDFDDVMSELLSNEESFNHIGLQIHKLDTVMSEMSKRIVNLENENGKFHRSNIEIVAENTKLQKGVAASSALIEQRIGKMEERIHIIEESSKLALSKLMERLERIERRELEKSPHPTTFTHQLLPVFEDQRSDQSMGVAILQDGVWHVQLQVVILQHFEGVGSINYLNNQVPVGFSPSQVVDIQTSKEGVSMEINKVILGYVNYESRADDEYPHTVVIRMTLK